MSKLSYKTLLIIFCFLLIGVIVLAKFVLPKNIIKANWWNDGWHYRQAISISNTSGSDQSDMVIKINIDTSTLISTNKIQSTCNDIRVTDLNGNVLPHYVTQCNTSSTNVYAKIANIPSSGNSVYIYYGNSTANNIETNSIFTYFDDFESGTSQDTWATSNISVGITSGFANKGNFSQKFIAQGSSYDTITQTFSITHNWTNQYLEYEFYTDVANAWWMTDPKNSSGNRMNPWNNFTMNASSWVTFSKDLNTNTYVTDVKSVFYATQSDDINRNIFIDNFRIRYCLSTITTGTPQSEEVGGGPISYWKFDEGVGTTVYDSSGNNNGILFGTTLPTWASENQCISGKCISSPGANSNISVSDNNSLKPNQITISGWVKINESKNQYIINKGDGSGTGAGYNVYIYSNNRLAFWFYNGAGNITLIDTGANSIQLNNWYFFEATYNGTNSKIYLNGVLKSTSPNTSGFIQRNSNLNINNNSFNGLIDDVKIYNYARTTDQIKIDYNSRGSSSGSSVNLGIKSSTAPDLNSSLVAYWKFDENNGNTVSNSGIVGIGLSGVFAIGNSAPVWVDGKKNKALSFNRSQYLTINDNSVFTINSNGFTYSAWIKAYSFPDTFNMIMGHYLPYFQVYSNGKLHLSMNANGGQKSVIGITTLLPNNWYHVSTTYDNQGYMKVYVNGKLDGIAGPYPNPSTISSNFYIGKWNSGDEYKFNGIIDEVKVYNRALTDDEIKQDYNQGSAIQFGSTTQTIGGTTTDLKYCIPGDTSYCASPIAEWNFEENIGTVTKDTSKDNFNGLFNTGNYAPTWAIGKNNKGAGINFNGESNSSYIGTSFPSTPPTSYTAEAWIKPNSISGASHTTFGYTIMAASSSNATRYPIWLLLKDGEIRLSAFSDSSIAYNQTSGANIQINKWYHVTVSATQNGIATIYVNGIGLTSFSSGNTPWTTLDKLTFSDLRPDRNISFNGIIDDVKIYDYIRTPAQISYDYNKGAPIGWWKLDECQGSIAHDSSGLGNNGTISIGQSGIQNSLGTCQIGISAAWTAGASGHTNSSLNFDGIDDYIQNPTTISMFTNYSISLWIKQTAFLSNPNPYAKIIFGGNNNNCDLYDMGSNYSFYLNGASQMSVTPTNTHKWNHVIVSINGNTGYLYFNGELKTTNSSLPLTNCINKNIGGGIASRWFNGQIDDVRVYNYTLTVEQAKQIYNGGAVSFN